MNNGIWLPILTTALGRQTRRQCPISSAQSLTFFPFLLPSIHYHTIYSFSLMQLVIEDDRVIAGRYRKAIINIRPFWIDIVIDTQHWNILKKWPFFFKSRFFRLFICRVPCRSAIASNGLFSSFSRHTFLNGIEWIENERHELMSEARIVCRGEIQSRFVHHFFLGICSVSSATSVGYSEIFFDSFYHAQSCFMQLALKIISNDLHSIENNCCNLT